MEPLTVPTSMYTVQTSYSVASIRHAEYAVYTTVYSVCTIKYTVQIIA